MNVIRYLLERGTERSTWLGIVTLIGLFGVTLGDGLVQAIAGALVALCGGILAIMSELRLFPQAPAEDTQPTTDGQPPA